MDEWSEKGYKIFIFQTMCLEKREERILTYFFIFQKKDFNYSSNLPLLNSLLIKQHTTKGDKLVDHIFEVEKGKLNKINKFYIPHAV